MNLEDNMKHAYGGFPTELIEEALLTATLLDETLWAVQPEAGGEPEL